MTSSITSADGTPLLVRRWSAGSDRWAQMLLVHGLAEHSGRYERTGGLLAEAGIDVTAFDLRGHGGSGGRRGDVERWTDYLDDIAVRLAAVRAEADGRPVVLFAHSFGGLISTDYVLSGRPAAGPAGAVGARARRRLAALAAHRRSADCPDRCRRSRSRIRGARRPCLAIRRWGGWCSWTLAVPIGRLLRLGAFGFAAQERVRSRLATLAVPTLVFHGSDDRLVPPTATRAFRRAAWRHPARVPGASARDAQRAGGPAGGRRRHRVAARGGGPAAGRRGGTLGGIAGSGGKIRTYDQAVNSRPLYH